jgi:hypothetical protein
VYEYTITATKVRVKLLYLQNTIKYKARIVRVLFYPCIPSPSISPDNREYTVLDGISFIKDISAGLHFHFQHITIQAEKGAIFND